MIYLKKLPILFEDDQIIWSSSWKQDLSFAYKSIQVDSNLRHSNITYVVATHCVEKSDSKPKDPGANPTTSEFTTTKPAL
jgi:hypothetical protein